MGNQLKKIPIVGETVNNMIESVPIVGEAYKGVSSAIGGRRKLGGMAVLHHAGGVGSALTGYADSIPIYRGPTDNMKEVFGAGLPQRIGGNMPTRIGGAMVNAIDLTKLTPEEINIAQTVMNEIMASMPKWDFAKHLNSKGSYYVPDNIANAFSSDYVWDVEKINKVIETNRQPVTLAGMMTIVRRILANPRLTPELKKGWIQALIQGISYSNFKVVEGMRGSRVSNFRKRNFGRRRFGGRRRGRKFRRRIRSRVRRRARSYRRLGYGKKRKTTSRRKRLPPRDSKGRFKRVGSKARRSRSKSRRRRGGRRRRFNKRNIRRRFRRRFMRRRRGGASEMDYENIASPIAGMVGNKIMRDSRVQTLLSKVPEGMKKTIVEQAGKYGKMGITKLVKYLANKIAS